MATIYTWQQSGDRVRKDTAGMVSYAGSLEMQAAYGRVKVQVESFPVGPNKPRVGIEVTRRGYRREILTDTSLLLSIPEAVSLCGHLHAAIMAAQADSQSNPA